jgi:hypothetical protein
MYENLKKAIQEEYNKERELAIKNIKTEESSLKRHSTETRWSQYKTGELAHEKAVELATKRAMKEIDKLEAEKLQQIEWVAQASAPDFINISVEWHKSRTWGSCPKVEARTQGGYFTGSASGCGYDKESAAIAQALNQSRSVLKLLYDVKEQNIAKSSHDCLGYGSGHGILPYFEQAGVGVGCFRDIFRRLGYKWECTASGKTFDVYAVTKEK